MGTDGVEIFTNSSASHHELRKADSRVTLIKSATTKVTFNQVLKGSYKIIKCLLVLNKIYGLCNTDSCPQFYL